MLLNGFIHFILFYLFIFLILLYTPYVNMSDI